jgi:hypothetical protein
MGSDERGPSRREILRASLLGAGGIAAFGANLLPLDAIASSLAATPSGQWSHLNPSTSPAGRAFASMAYDAVHEVNVLFGGIGGRADTWIYDGAIWRELVTSTHPRSLSGTSMAYHAASSRIVLFGGSDGSGASDETWLWDGEAWLTADSPIKPPPRLGANLAHDPRNGVLVLFGGFDGERALSDTWIWSGSRWYDVVPQTSPPPLFGASSFYSPRHGAVMLYGGSSSPMGIAGWATNWLWDGRAWSRTESGPESRRSFAALAGDLGERQLLLFGGLDGANFCNETIELDAALQNQAVYRPPARAYASMAPTKHGSVLLFGGQGGEGRRSFLNDTWLWTPGI